MALTCISTTLHVLLVMHMHILHVLVIDISHHYTLIIIVTLLVHKFVAPVPQESLGEYSYAVFSCLQLLSSELPSSSSIYLQIVAV